MPKAACSIASGQEVRFFCDREGTMKTEPAMRSRLRGQRRNGSPLGDDAHGQDWKGCSDRKVLCNILEHKPCGSPENIKIQIPNERALRTKRFLEESLEGQSLLGAFKKPRLRHLYCSTPCPAQKQAAAISTDSACFPGSSSCFDETDPGRLGPSIGISLPRNDSLALSSLASKQDQNEEDDLLLEESDSEVGLPFHFTEEIQELDDSLLEASDSEADSPFHFTEEEIQELLEEDDLSVTGVGREPSPSDHCSAEEREPDCYTFQLSPRDVMGGSSLSQSSCSSVPSSLLTLDMTGYEKSLPLEQRECEGLPLEQDMLGCNQIVNLPFDFDIDELLALSPIDGSSINQEVEDCVVVEDAEVQYAPMQDDGIGNKSKCDTKLQKNFGPTKQEQTLPLDQQILKGVPEVCSAAAEEHPLCPAEMSVQPCSHSLGLCVSNPSASVQLSRSQDGASLEEVASEILPFKSIDIPAKEGHASPGESISSSQNGNLQKSRLLEEAALLPDTVMQIILAKDYRGENLPGKKLGKVSPVEKAEERQVRIPSTELERKKQMYVQCVLKHIQSPRAPNQDAFKELLTLMDQVASVEYRHQDRRWQHPSDLTMRSYPRFSKKLPNKWNLKQWVSRNGGYQRRFQSLADRFQRSSVLN
ncbi:S100P-binding protein isoform X2 [Rhinatrema bivittatum]|uniref:S100P-binding protein isoform X2 n=1 Tax=Rhinatrema bivittatum TaxID=194408 RepID=UPI00112B9CF5|nr:S100P-binding protein isoform X2 [Rhinatrema bivittatum]